MTGSQRQATVAAAVQRVTVLWGALIASLAVYVVIALAIGPVAPLWPRVAGTGAAAMLYGAAGAFFGAAFILRRVLLRGATGVQAAGQRAVLSRYFSAVLASNAVAESVAMLAVVGHLVGLDTGTMFTIVLASAVCMLLLRPRAAELESLLPRD